MKSKFILLSIIALLLQLKGFAQLTPMFEWSSVLPYNGGQCVSEADDYIYLGTTTGIVRIAKADNSIRRFSKEDGMADLNVSAIGYSNSANALIIGYKNGNIDVKVGDEFYNLPELYNSGSISNKVIYSITVKNNLAYVCAGYGISIIDLNTRKFKSTAKFQPAGQPEFAVYDIALSNSLIYAATAKGVYAYNETNLFEDFGSWTLTSGLPNGHFSFVEFFNNTLYVVFSNQLTNAIDDNDTLYSLNGSNFTPLPEFYDNSINGLKENRNKLCITQKSTVNGPKITVKNSNLSNFVTSAFDYYSNSSTGLFADNQKTYIPDAFYGLLVLSESGYIDFVSASGPLSNRTRKITFYNDIINIATGGFTGTYGQAYIGEGMFFKNGETWSYQNFINQPLMSTMVDMVTLINDVKKPNINYAGALVGGLYKFEDQICTQVYDYNTTGGVIGTSTKTTVTAIKSDADGNVFFAHNGATPIAILKQDGTILPFPVANLNATDKVLDILHINKEIVWIATYNKGIIAVKHSELMPQNFRFLNTNVGSGKLTSMNVTSIALDKDGEVWAGTNNGFTVFYNPQSVFTQGINIDASQPIVKADDGKNEPMLKGANITSITVDGGNRKWICTQGAGVTLLSEDGFIIEHSFTKSNSPLLSDNVFNADIEPKSGMVYFSTENGISVFRSNASEADEEFSDVYSFPNPVRPGYNGYVTITGLANDSEVKITDTNGQLVYETIAHGGTAIWNLHGYNGIKARSGVYLVFANGSEKKAKHVTKILIMQ